MIILKKVTVAAIAKEAGVIYWKGMFFEDDKDVELYLQQTQSVEKRLTDDVLPADIVKADIKMRISYSMIENIKNLFIQSHVNFQTLLKRYT